MPIPVRSTGAHYKYHVYDIPCNHVAPCLQCAHNARENFAAANVNKWLPPAPVPEQAGRADASKRTAEKPEGVNVNLRHRHQNDNKTNHTDNQRLSLRSDLEDLKTSADPKLNAEVGSLGQTYFGREIPFIKFGSGGLAGLPQILLTGGVHAREWIAVEIPFLIAEYLIKHYDPAAPAASPLRKIRYVLENCQVIVIPMLNPDGHCWSVATKESIWRKNRRRWTKTQLVNGYPIYGKEFWSRKLKYKDEQNNWNTPERTDGAKRTGGFEIKFQDKVDENRTYFGVDCNRNCWQGGNNTEPDPTIETFAGPEAFSERESEYLKTMIDGLPTLAASIDYHSAMGRIFYHGNIEVNQPAAPLNDKQKQEQAVRRVGACMYDHINAYESKNGGEDYRHKYGDSATTIEAESGKPNSSKGSIMDLCYRKMIAGNRIPLAYTIELDPVKPVGGGDYLPGPASANKRWFHVPPTHIKQVFEKNLTAVLCLMDNALQNPRIASDAARGNQGQTIAQRNCPFAHNNHEWVGKVSGRGNQAPNP